MFRGLPRLFLLQLFREHYTYYVGLPDRTLCPVRKIGFCRLFRYKTARYSNRPNSRDPYEYAQNVDGTFLRCSGGHDNVIVDFRFMGDGLNSAKVGTRFSGFWFTFKFFVMWPLEICVTLKFFKSQTTRNTQMSLNICIKTRPISPNTIWWTKNKYLQVKSGLVLWYGHVSTHILSYTTTVYKINDKVHCTKITRAYNKLPLLTVFPIKIEIHIGHPCKNRLVLNYIMELLVTP